MDANKSKTVTFNLAPGSDPHISHIPVTPETCQGRTAISGSFGDEQLYENPLVSSTPSKRQEQPSWHPLLNDSVDSILSTGPIDSLNSTLSLEPITVHTYKPSWNLPPNVIAQSDFNTGLLQPGIVQQQQQKQLQSLNEPMHITIACS